MSIDPGFDAGNVVQGRIALPNRYSEPADIIDVQRRIVTSLRAIPGAVDAAQINGFPLLNEVGSTPIMVRGEPVEAGESQPHVRLMIVSPSYFSTMGMRVLEGRDFNDEDSLRENPVIIVDETFAKRYFPGKTVVGQEILPGNRPPPGDYVWPRIIGVVNRANLGGLEEHDNVPFVFGPSNGLVNVGFNVLVRSPRPTNEVLRDIRTKLREIDPALPLYAEGSLQQGLDAMLMPRRGIMLLLATFSGLALVLAAIGLYGVLAYDVSQRTREIGIRGALGAPRGSIINLVLRQSLWKTGVGLLLGLAGGLVMSRSMESLLFEVTPLDPVAYVCVCAALLLVATLASWLPARRAASVDPVIALRAE
jgi:predicted permease